MPFRPLLIAFFLTAFCGLSFAQSGRVKPTESPTPNSAPKQPGVYVPTTDRPRVSASAPVPTPTPPAGENGDVIKVDSTLIPIPVSVLDAAGRQVISLTLNDFVLKIDGINAEIGEITRSETPIRLVMLFDNSGSVVKAREFEKQAAIKFFRNVLRPGKDMAALYSIATIPYLEQRFTGDFALLTRSIENMPPPEGATALLDGIERAAEYLSEIQGRRVIVIVSDGEDTKTDTTLEAAVRRAQIANCQVFVVKTTDFENYVRTGSRKPNANIMQLAAEQRMLEIARQTGGAVYSPVDEREVDDAFRSISAELSQQFILSYYPENDDDKRGQFRTIDVEVKNRQNLSVRTRKGYYVPRQ